MKKAMAILLAAVLALACTACGGSKNGETKDRLAQIKEKGYIELCTEPYFAPYEYVDPNKSGEDQYQGMDIEVARYIAELKENGQTDIWYSEYEEQAAALGIE